MADTKLRLAMCLQVETEYGTSRIVARIVTVADDGSLRNPLSSSYDDDAPYADFAVTAYVDNEHTAPWGMSYEYRRPFTVNLRTAENMVKILRKIDRGMQRLNASQGYVTENNYAEYLFRVAGVLGIREYYVRNTDKARARSGEMFGKRDGAGVQYWVADRVSEAPAPARF